MITSPWFSVHCVRNDGKQKSSVRECAETIIFFSFFFFRLNVIWFDLRSVDVCFSGLFVLINDSDFIVQRAFKLIRKVVQHRLLIKPLKFESKAANRFKILWKSFVSFYFLPDV